MRLIDAEALHSRIKKFADKVNPDEIKTSNDTMKRLGYYAMMDCANLVAEAPTVDLHKVVGDSHALDPEFVSDDAIGVYMDVLDDLIAVIEGV